MRRILLAAVIVLLALVAGWVALRLVPGARPVEVSKVIAGEVAAGEEEAPAPAPPGLRGAPDAPGEVAAPTPEEEEVEALAFESVGWDDLPPDPVEEGECTLALAFVEAATGEPYATAFDLWRLDAPGNADWHRGDQRQTSGQRGTEATLDGLPAGRYRLHVHGAREGAEDPPAFAVSGSDTRVQVAVEAPISKSVYVLVFDERGTPLVRGERVYGGFGTYSRSADRPAWVQRRRLTGNRMFAGGRFSMGHGDGVSKRPPEAVEASAEGFLIRTCRAARRYDSMSFSCRFLFPERAAVRTYVSEKELPERCFVALSPPLRLLEDRIRLPDGRRVYRTDLLLEAECAAVAIGPGDDPWTVASTLPLEVRAMDGKRCVASGTIRLGDAEVVLASRP